MSVPADRSKKRLRFPPFVAALIAVSVLLQLIATSRILCPPQSMKGLAWLRIACPPRMWPFIDYPMFSAPHRRGEQLAWVEASAEATDGSAMCMTSREVQRASADETWERAYERVESSLRAEMAPKLAGVRLVLERHLLVLTEDGLVPP